MKKQFKPTVSEVLYLNQGPLDIQIQQADLSQPKMYEAYLKKETAKHVKLVLELMSWVFTMHYKRFFDKPCRRIEICLTCTCIIISL